MNFKFIKHCSINQRDLHDVISLKKTHWDYSIDEHISWIKGNINEEDIHVLMFEQNILVAYLNLIKIDVIINDKSYPFLGVGNVCSKEKGKGYGKELIVRLNQFLVENNYNGMLFCKDNLVPFYERYNWKLIDKSIISKSICYTTNIMLFNFTNNIINFVYKGRNF